MDQVARIVLALEAPEVAEEVMHFLDRSGRARVVATAGDGRQLAEAIRQLEPDAIVAAPTMLGGRQGTGVILALDTRESVTSLRTAIRAGAAGYFLWPKEREDLLGAAAAAVRRSRETARRGTVVAVHGGRGGVGVTFVATHLAAAFARRGSVILIDADPVFGDVAQALGAPAGDDAEPVHTFTRSPTPRPSGTISAQSSSRERCGGMRARSTSSFRRRPRRPRASDRRSSGSSWMRPPRVPMSSSSICLEPSAP